ncbi:MAG: hypothetical protein DSY59_04535, partial [Persephonella sp.]
NEIKEKELVENLNIDDFETVKVIDTFIYRFLKLQDFMGQKLFRRFLMVIGDFYEDMSFIDILDKLEKLNIITSSDDWIRIRKLRNKLTYEYPDEIEEMKNEILMAIEMIHLFEETLSNIEEYLRKRNLL